ncbi:hypothetical protein FRX31_008150, partial [Thalictrum thalictroides]
NCHKKNPQPADTGLVGQAHTQNGKQAQNQGNWQTQRPKRVYRQVTKSNDQEAGPSGTKNFQGQEVNETQTTQKGTSNTFSVLNNIDDNNLEKESEEGELPAQDGETNISTMASTDNVSLMTAQTGTVNEESLEGNLEDQGTLKGKFKTSQDKSEGILEEELEYTPANEPVVNNDVRSTAADFTQVIDVINERPRNTQNASRSKGIAEEFISSEIINLEKDVLNHHALVIPLAIEAPVSSQLQPLLLTDGDQSEGEQSEGEQSEKGEDISEE